jgi:IS605 OrfB family transposase
MEGNLPYNLGMKLTIQLQLLPTMEQIDLLRETMHHFNEAATFAAQLGFEAGVFSQPSVHKLAYRAIRDRFGLSAQLAVRAIGKAVECFARDKKVCPVFRPDGAITYDQRNLSFKGLDRVSLSTLTGREVIGIVYGEYQRERFDRIKGQCDLIRRDGKFYLLATVDLPEAPPLEVKDFVGVDLGIVNIATTDDGETFVGKPTDDSRRRNARARQTYQSTNTRSSRRRMRKLGKRQSRFQRDGNHVISKKIVAKALATQSGIAVEELTGIGSRVTVRHAQRSRLGNWSFHQLRSFLTYKAKLVGVPIVAVDPRNTSRACSKCGHCEKANRKSQSVFQCKQCGFSCNADQNGACNIQLRALGLSVNQPDLVAAKG